ncbi:MAG: FAD-dependent oxidoreductase, partial [Oxalobacteraceae bacterium]|nr:FAD-dependent oxidoreductase [Oxalobacteraceae bacterium]
MRPTTVAVIGAGWAGCAAAVELSRAGAQVTLYEAARTAGGRARRIDYQGNTLDNGQHILLGAYRESLRLMRMVGLEPSKLLLRLPLQMRYPSKGDGMNLLAPRLPAPLHLLLGVLRTKGLSLADKLSLARFATAARWMGWQLNLDCTVAELLERFEQTDRLTQLMWRPLCIAALNTAPERASAKVFLAVLRDSLGASRAASDMLLPRTDLSALFPDAAIKWLQKNGGKVMLRNRVNAIHANDSGWTISSEQDTDQVQQVVIATSAAHAQSLVLGIDGALADMLDFEYEAITTCYLQYAPTVRLPAPMLALIDDPDNERWGQFVFDRGQLDATQAGLLAVVISASGTAAESGAQAIEASVAQQLAHDLQMPELATPLWSKAITEKRATFACVPDLPRPPNTTAHTGLWLAGDYTE